MFGRRGEVGYVGGKVLKYCAYRFKEVGFLKDEGNIKVFGEGVE